MLARIPVRIGYDTPEVKPFINLVALYDKQRHEVAQNLRLMANAAGVSEPEAAPQSFPLEFQVTRAAEAAAQNFLRAHGVAESARFAVIAPGSGARVKLWRDEGFARVTDALHERYCLRVILIGGKDEQQLAARISAQAHAPIINAAGQTTLAQLAALFARARLAVGVDNGPMHLAVAMGTPSVHLFGPVAARAFGPWGHPARHIVLTSGLACIPCNRLDYSEAEVVAHPCVRLINERQVLAAIEKVIGDV
jgi:ADP-heptose:LPS heptosyltransferase